MADPTKYVKAYSFAGFQANSPSTPLPGGSLDAELNNASASIGEIVDALRDVRRSDGGLVGGIVTFDALSPAVQDLVSGESGGTTTADLDPSVYATQGQAETGSDNTRLMTPLRVKQAVDAQRAFASQDQAEAGVASTVSMSPLRVKQALDALRNFATQAEAEAGTATGVVMSPLRSAQAFSAHFLARIAGQSEAEAGTDNTKAVTPLRVKQALDALRAFASSGEATTGTNTTKVMNPATTKAAIEGFREAYTASKTIAFGEITAGAVATDTITVTGAAVGDRVAVAQPAAGVNNGIVVDAWVSAADTVTVRALNTTSGALTPASATYGVTVLGF